MWPIWGPDGSQVELLEIMDKTILMLYQSCGESASNFTANVPSENTVTFVRLFILFLKTHEQSLLREESYATCITNHFVMIWTTRSMAIACKANRTFLGIDCGC